MRDMYNLYAKRSTSELNRLRSKKYLRMTKVRGEYGWFNQREADRLEGQIKAIDAELAKRKAQQALF